MNLSRDVIISSLISEIENFQLGKGLFLHKKLNLRETTEPHKLYRVSK